MPCYKLGIRFNRRDMVKRFLVSKRTGFYLAVLREGEVEKGDAIEFTEKQESGVTIMDIVNLYSTDSETRSCSAAQPIYPLRCKAGKIIFGNVFGMPMLEMGSNHLP
jgi:MOSC domain-containing protein YiiM